MYSRCLCEFCVCVCFYALLCVHSSLAIILKRKRKLVALLVFLTDVCYYKCSVALPHSDVVLFAVCDCGFS